MKQLAVYSIYALGIIWLMVAFAIMEIRANMQSERSFFRLIVIAFCVTTIANVLNWLNDTSFLERFDNPALMRWAGLRLFGVLIGVLCLIWAVRYGRQREAGLRSAGGQSDRVGGNDMPSGPNTPPGNNPRENAAPAPAPAPTVPPVDPTPTPTPTPDDD